MYCARSKAEGLGSGFDSCCLSSAGQIRIRAFHPFQDAGFDFLKMVYAVSQQRGAEHGDVGADHQQLNHILVTMHAAGRSQVGADAAVENSDPSQSSRSAAEC